jgi:hypothetical protein
MSSVRTHARVHTHEHPPAHRVHARTRTHIHLEACVRAAFSACRRGRYGSSGKRKCDGYLCGGACALARASTEGHLASAPSAHRKQKARRNNRHDIISGAHGRIEERTQRSAPVVALILARGANGPSLRLSSDVLRDIGESGSSSGTSTTSAIDTAGVQIRYGSSMRIRKVWAVVVAAS